MKDSIMIIFSKESFFVIAMMVPAAMQCSQPQPGKPTFAPEVEEHLSNKAVRSQSPKGEQLVLPSHSYSKAVAKLHEKNQEILNFLENDAVVSGNIVMFTLPSLEVIKHHLKQEDTILQKLSGHYAVMKKEYKARAKLEFEIEQLEQEHLDLLAEQRDQAFKEAQDIPEVE
jgi:hypothetical protein